MTPKGVNPPFNKPNHPYWDCSNEGLLLKRNRPIRYVKVLERNRLIYRAFNKFPKKSLLDPYRKLAKDFKVHISTMYRIIKQFKTAKQKS